MTKLAAVERLGGRIVRVPWEQWWAAVEADGERDPAEDVDGFFVHPVRDPPVMAGNGTIGLELVEDLDEIDAVLIPWGGGGLTTGIASALHALSPETKVYVCEPETGAPVTAAIAERTEPGVDRVHAVVRRRRGFGSAPAEDVGARARPRHRRLRDLARGTRPPVSGCSSGRASSPRELRLCRSRRPWRGAAERAGSCASSRAGTSTPARLARSSPAASRTSRRGSSRPATHSRSSAAGIAIARRGSGRPHDSSTTQTELSQPSPEHAPCRVELGALLGDEDAHERPADLDLESHSGIAAP